MTAPNDTTDTPAAAKIRERNQGRRLDATCPACAGAVTDADVRAEIRAEIRDWRRQAAEYAERPTPDDTRAVVLLQDAALLLDALASARPDSQPTPNSPQVRSSASARPPGAEDAGEAEGVANRVWASGVLDPNDGDTDSADPADWIIAAARRAIDRASDAAPAPAPAPVGEDTARLDWLHETLAVFAVDVYGPSIDDEDDRTFAVRLHGVSVTGEGESLRAAIDAAMQADRAAGAPARGAEGAE